MLVLLEESFPYSYFLVFVKVLCSNISPLLLIFFKKLNFYGYLLFSTVPCLDGEDEADGKKACSCTAM
jgi:hypothetical protein